ncbi:hypothetical protein PC118_g15339 [Phytophthora cactorum]|uniref:Chromo domain-containing protein n=1 Tax=Phytophthora cactorum TaxID=29920 RepID=A0A8T1BQJ3_9STRA|nr:hypothetical protein PC112_g5765 [Phytophthora cactorum]KAG2863468.1 hypothetical protein PC113_g5410 [Phytophthora cactorum]KAG2905285.1 hypothetical protein PC115_g14682 [Phytophthora cactorum]KAG2973053.1 hypothetical protein PC118_g15339 [Phytophthora cactorum]KAG3083465.1 hypothetical protein PC121_g5729 [Phytophthora cactorum]
MHRDLGEAKTKQTRRNQKNQRSAHPVNFHVGDYVLWSGIESRLKTNKLFVKWVDPYKVVDAKPNSFTVKHLIDGSNRDIHPSRFKRYADSLFDVMEEIREHISNQDIYLTVRGLLDHRNSTTRY